MKKLLFTTFVALTGFLWSETLNVNIKDIKPLKGNIVVSVFNKEDGFLKKE